MPNVEAAVRSHTGRVRESNEDNFYLNGIFMNAQQRSAGGLFSGLHKSKRQLYAVCDGMGGMSSGEKASLQAVSHLGNLLSANNRQFPKHLQVYIDEMSALFQSFNDGARSAGCTLALVYFDCSHVRIAHLGDSRVHFKRGSLLLTQVTDDHSQAEWYTQQGISMHKEIAVRSSKNVLRRYLGAPVPEGRVPDILDAMRVRQGDVFLLCSDGLSNMVNIHEIDNEISKNKNCADVCKALTSMALERGGDDNITVMMLKIL